MNKREIVCVCGSRLITTLSESKIVKEKGWIIYPYSSLGNCPNHPLPSNRYRIICKLRMNDV